MVSSSRPSSPCTIITRTAPLLAQHAEHALGQRGVGQPHHLAPHPGRVGHRPEDVERRRHAQLPSGRPGVAQRRVEAGREAERHARRLDAADARRRASSSSRTPSASSRSAAPHADEAARLPCLHTGTPAPATTNEASVDTLIVWLRSPPVPTMSTSRSRSASSHVDQGRGRQHGVEQPAQLLDRLALHAQGHDEAGQLRRRGRAFEDLGHGRPGRLGRAGPAGRAAARAPPASRRARRGWSSGGG